MAEARMWAPRVVPAVALAMAATSASSADGRGMAIPLRPLTTAEMAAAETMGVGCTWSLPGERATRFAAADDHAAVKIGGRVVRLRPARGARDMFVFTYNAWTDGDLRLTVAKVRGGRRRGSVIANEAVLMLVTANGSYTTTGQLECGD